MPNLKLTMALSNYDRHIPFINRTVQPDGIDLRVLEVGQSIALKDGTDRHERMFQKREFDLAEVSLSSYLMAKSRGMPFIAIPVFPRRLFSQSLIYVNVNSRIQSPKDLTGKKIGLSGFQTTLSVLAKGDLQSEYGVPWRQIEWILSSEGPVSLPAIAGASIRSLPAGKKIGDMLESGEIDALAMPHPPKVVQRGSKNIARLFSDARQEELNYYRKTGFFPIMHVIAFRDDVLEKNPWAARSIMEAFEKAEATTHDYYDDPNWSMLLWAKHLWEEQKTLLGEDPWRNGVKRNWANLERFMGYSQDQKLIPRRLSPEELFHETALDT